MMGQSHPPPPTMGQPHPSYNQPGGSYHPPPPNHGGYHPPPTRKAPGPSLTRTQSDQPPPPRDNGNRTPPRKNKGKQRARSVDSAPQDDEDEATKRLNERLLRAGISMSLEGDEPDDETAILINEILLRLEAARAEVDHLRTANATLRKGRKREAPSEEDRDEEQRPPKRRDFQASEDGGSSYTHTPNPPVGHALPPAPHDERVERAGPSQPRRNMRASSSRQPRYETRDPPSAYEEDIKMDTDAYIPFVPRGFGPVTLVTMPPSYPAPPAVENDPTIERASPPRDSDESSSDESVELWDEDPQSIARAQGGDWPSEADLRNRRKHNRDVKEEKELRAKALAEKRRRVERQMSGRVPDGLGVVRIPPSNSIERNNAMLGMWPRQRIYYSARTNIVYVGQSAAVASQFEMQNQSGYRPVHGHPLYSRVPRGVPRNPEELDRLMTIAANARLDDTVRMEAYCLLTEFHTVIGRIHPALWDRTMAAFMDSGFNQSYQPDVGPHFMGPAPIARDFSRAIVSNPSNSTRGAGMPTPDPRESLNQDVMGQYIMLHGRPGSSNPFLGVVMDHSYRIHRRSLFGYGLGRMLAPANSHARSVFMRLYAALTAMPFRYTDAVAAHNVNNPGAPMHPQAGPQFVFQRLVIDDRHASNMTIEDIIQVLIHNCIPTDWVDHAYLYGLQFLDQHYHGSALDRALLDEQDNERLHRLDQYGAPPAIPAWDGWRHPTEDEILRMHIILDTEEQRGVFSLNARGWLLTGDTPYRRYLSGRSRNDADAGVAELRARLLAATAITTNTAIAPPPPPPPPAALPTSSSDDATANAVASTTSSLVNTNDTTLDGTQDAVMENTDDGGENHANDHDDPPPPSQPHMED
jgi:hypothetical protein